MVGKTIRNMTLIGMVFYGLIFLSCASPQAPEPSLKEPGATTATGQKASQQQGWEMDWQKTLAMAKKERGLTIYSPASGELRTVVTKAFKDTYGLEVEWTVGKAQELPTKVLQERRAGLYLADLINGSISTQMTILKPAGVFDPIKPLLVLPDVLDTKLWYYGQMPWIDNEKSFTLNPLLSPSNRLAINTDLVKPDQLKSYNDLLDSRFKEKIILSNPLLYQRVFSETLTIMGVDFWRKLAANGPVIVDDEGLGAQWLAHGKYPIYLVNRADVVTAFMSAGAPVKKVALQEGVMLAGGAMATSLFKNAPHPNAAKVFMNWYMGKEASILLQRLNTMQSARLDVPPDSLPQDALRSDSVKYVNAETEEFQLKQAEYAKLAREIFGPVLGR